MSSIRWAEVIKPSNDRGPYKMVEVESDGHTFIAHVIEPYGVQSSPLKGGQALIIPVDDDEGKAVALILPPPAKRTDQQKEGEASFVSHKTGNALKHDDDGHTTITTPGGCIIKEWKDGRIGVQPGAGQKVFLGEVGGAGCHPVVTTAGPSSNVFAKVG